MNTDILQAFNNLQDAPKKDQHNQITALATKLNGTTNYFNHILRHLLQSSTTQANIKMFKLLLTILDHCEESNAGIKDTISTFLFDHLTCTSKNIRKNAILFLNLLLNTDQKEKHLSIIAERLFDKNKSVRIQAILFLSKFQNCKVNNKTFSYSLFKDLLRYDPNADVRKNVLKLIVINDKTLSAVLEKVIDKELVIRKMFYEEIVELIDFKKIKGEGLAFLIDKALAERQMDYSRKIVNKLVIDFDLQNNLFSFLNEYSFEKMEKVIELVLEKITVPELKLPMTEKEVLFLKVYYNFVETQFGRENLKLFDIYEFTTHFYNILVNSDNLTSSFVKNLFSLLNYYEIFDEDIKKAVKCTIYKLLTSNTNEEIIEQCVILSKKYFNDITFIGSTIKKTMQTNPDSFVYICKYFMKHYNVFEEIHRVIVNEIVLNHKAHKCFYEILFYFLILENDTEILDLFYECSNLELLVDFYILKNDINVKNKLEVLFDEAIASKKETVVIQLAKYMLAKNITFTSYFKYLILTFYTTSDDKIKQYLTVFFYEFINKNPALLTDTFCDIYVSLENGNLFLKQSLKWLENVEARHFQILFFNVCVYLLGNVSHTSFLTVLANITVSDTWEKVLLKKIIYCCTVLSKKIEKSALLDDILCKLIKLDDGKALSEDELQSLKSII